jgi:hypothetical protein
MIMGTVLFAPLLVTLSNSVVDLAHAWLARVSNTTGNAPPRQATPAGRVQSTAAASADRPSSSSSGNERRSMTLSTA